ncbi:MAG: ATP-binding protein [Magnetospirillum sp. WYHS-4]
MIDSALLFATLLVLRRAPGAMAGLGWWAAAFGLHTLRYALLFAEPTAGIAFVTFASESLQAGSAAMMLGGTLLHLEKPMRPWMIVAGCVVPVAWVAATVFGGAGWLATTLPVYFFGGGVMIFSGWVLIRNHPQGWRSGRSFTGLMLILWGLHRLDYPFLRPIPEIAVWGFLLAHVFEVLLALGLILMSQRHLILHVAAETEMRLEAETYARQSSTALAESVDQLTHSSTELGRLVRTLNHDLQEPLRNIITYSQMLSRRLGPAADPELREEADFITGAAMRLRLVIGGLTAYSRVSAETRPFRPFKAEIAVQAAMGDLEQELLGRQAVVTFSPLPSVFGDPGQISLLFRHLIENAVRFSAPETVPAIHIAAVQEEDSWTFSIRDNAMGIERRYWDRIFEPGWKGQNQPSSGGTGLGLAICRRIVAQHGGRIWVEESDVGKGTEVHFTLSSEAKKSPEGPGVR